MDEWSRIVLEEYCASHKSAKSRRIGKLVEMSYDMFCEPTDSDAIFLEKAFIVYPELIWCISGNRRMSLCPALLSRHNR